MDGIELVHTVRDANVTDRDGNRIGRIDELVLTITDKEPPRVSTILIGGQVRAERIGRWMQWLHRATSALFGVDASAGVSRIPFSALREIGATIRLDVSERDLPSEHLERWLGDRVIDRIPGSRGDRK